MERGWSLNKMGTGSPQPTTASRCVFLLHEELGKIWILFLILKKIIWIQFFIIQVIQVLHFIMVLKKFEF